MTGTRTPGERAQPGLRGATLRVWLLGGFRAEASGREVGAREWKLRKARSLVQILALAPNHQMHREQVSDALWPHLDAHAAANNLHVALHAARRALRTDPAVGSAPLLLDADHLSLSPSDGLWVDASAFAAAVDAARRGDDPEAHRAALDLYTGDLLPEDPYEEWVEPHRAALRARYLSLLGRLARLYEERGELDHAAGVLTALVEAEPAHEESHVALMRLHATMGRRDEALRQYALLRAALDRDPGVEPDRASERLFHEIRSGRFPAAGLVTSDPVAAAPRPRRPHNLPAPLSSFVGRAREVADVERGLRQARLLTIIGAGGGGKTRLALRVAEEVVGEYRDGVRLVELASVPDDAQLPRAVAKALGAREHAERPLPETLAELLEPQHILLVLDNCEHLVDAAAGLARRLLSACPELTILATSREALRVEGELAWRIPPLSLPDPSRGPRAEDAETSEAVQLFVLRARERDPAFALTAETAAPVVEICARLDGVPLALELAAARTGTLTARQIADRLGDALDLLSAGDRTAPARQRAMRATLDWSYDLLDPEERALLDRLSVFAGGWTLEAAETVGAGGRVGSGDVLSLLARLVEKSRVVADGAVGPAVRYRLLEPVRQYGLERLAEAGEERTARDRHAAFFLALAEAAEPRVTGPDQVAWLHGLEAEHANVRAALSWCLGSGDALTALRMSGALWRFWEMRGYQSEGRGWLESSIAAAPSDASAALARACNGAGMLAWEQGDYAYAERVATRSAHLYRERGDARGVAAALTTLGLLALDQGRDADAVALHEEALALRTDAGDPFGIAASLNSLGCVALDQGDYERAGPLLERSLALRREVGGPQSIAACLNALGAAALGGGDPERAAALHEEALLLRRELDDAVGIAYSHNNLGYAALERRKDGEAAAHWREALLLYHRTGYKRGVWNCVAGLSAVAAAQGRDERAARLWGAAEAIRASIGAPLRPADDAVYAPFVGAARGRLGSSAFLAAETAGRALPTRRAVETAMDEERPSSSH